MTSGFVEVTEEQLKLYQQSDWETSQSHPLGHELATRPLAAGERQDLPYSFVHNLARMT